MHQWKLFWRLVLWLMFYLITGAAIALVAGIIPVTPNVQTILVGVLTLVGSVFAVVLPLLKGRAPHAPDLKQNLATMTWDVGSAHGPFVQDCGAKTHHQVSSSTQARELEIVQDATEAFVGQRLRHAAHEGYVAVRTSVSEMDLYAWQPERLWRARSRASRLMEYPIPRPYRFYMVLVCSSTTSDIDRARKTALNSFLNRWPGSHLLVASFGETSGAGLAPSAVDSFTAEFTQPIIQRLHSLSGMTVSFLHLPPLLFGLRAYGEVVGRRLLRPILSMLVLSLAAVVTAQLTGVLNWDLSEALLFTATLPLINIFFVAIAILIITGPAATIRNPTIAVVCHGLASIYLGYVLSRVTEIHSPVFSLGLILGLTLFRQHKSSGWICRTADRNRALLLFISTTLLWIVLIPPEVEPQYWNIWGITAGLCSILYGLEGPPARWTKTVLYSLTVVTLMALATVGSGMDRQLQFSAKIAGESIPGATDVLLASSPYLALLGSLVLVSCFTIQALFQGSDETGLSLRPYYKDVVCALAVLFLGLIPLAISQGVEVYTSLNNIRGITSPQVIPAPPNWAFVSLTSLVTTTVACWPMAMVLLGLYISSVTQKDRAIYILFISQCLTAGMLVRLVYDAGWTTPHYRVVRIAVILTVILICAYRIFRLQAGQIFLTVVHLLLRGVLLTFFVLFPLFCVAALVGSIVGAAFFRYLPVHRGFNAAGVDLLHLLYESPLITSILLILLGVLLSISFGSPAGPRVARNALIHTSRPIVSASGVLLGIFAIVTSVRGLSVWRPGLDFEDFEAGILAASAAAGIYLLFTFRFTQSGINRFLGMVGIVALFGLLSEFVVAAVIILALLGGPFETIRRRVAVPTVRSLGFALALLCCFGLFSLGVDTSTSNVSFGSFSVASFWMWGVCIFGVAAVVHPFDASGFSWSILRANTDSLESFVFWIAAPLAALVSLSFIPYGLQPAEGMSPIGSLILTVVSSIGAAVAVYQGLTGWVCGAWVKRSTLDDASIRLGVPRKEVYGSLRSWFESGKATTEGHLVIFR